MRKLETRTIKMKPEIFFAAIEILFLYLVSNHTLKVAENMFSTFFSFLSFLPSVNEI